MVTRSVGANDGLSSERDYTARTLPRGVARGLADTVRGDRAGLGRSGAIVAGLAATTAGYAVGALSGVTERHRHRDYDHGTHSVAGAPWQTW